MPFIENQQRAYDDVILMPHGVLPVIQKENLPLSQRKLAEWPHYLGNIRYPGFAHQYMPPHKIISIPADVLDNEARVNLVLQALPAS